MIHTALDSHIPSRPEISGVYEAESSILGFSMLCTSDFAKKGNRKKCLALMTKAEKCGKSYRLLRFYENTEN